MPHPGHSFQMDPCYFACKRNITLTMVSVWNQTASPTSDTPDSLACTCANLQTGNEKLHTECDTFMKNKLYWFSMIYISPPTLVWSCSHDCHRLTLSSQRRQSTKSHISILMWLLWLWPLSLFCSLTPANGTLVQGNLRQEVFFRRLRKRKTKAQSPPCLHLYAGEVLRLMYVVSFSGPLKMLSALEWNAIVI